MARSLEGKTVLITGATGGIGQAMAICMAKEGARLIAHSRENNAASKNLISKLSKLGNAHKAIFADLASPNAIEGMFGKLPPIDILINNAGFCPKSPFLEIGLDEFESVMAVNFRAPFLISQHAAKKMRKGSSILFIASVDGFHPGQGRSHYGASKAAELSLMKNMALELAPVGIRVNAISPGAIDTPMISRVKSDKKKEATVLAGIPQKRFGKPEEIAEAACFLVGPKCPYATGTMFTVDGGLTLVRGY